MGYVYNLSAIGPGTIDKLLFPIILCLDKTKINRCLKGYKTLSLNTILSKRLLSLKEEKYYLYVIDEVNEIIQEEEGPLLITDFEILFDPSYKIDVLRLFIALNRRRKIAALWPGRYENNQLKFAEPEYEDYNTYNIEDYDLTCII